MITNKNRQPLYTLRQAALMNLHPLHLSSVKRWYFVIAQIEIIEHIVAHLPIQNVIEPIKIKGEEEMFRNNIILGLICLLVVGSLASSGWAVDSKQPAANEQKKTEIVQGTETESKPAATEEKGSQTETIEPKPIMEYTVDEEEEVVDVLFDKTTLSVKKAVALGMTGLEQKEETEIVNVPYPKVLVTRKAVKFLDEKGEVERKVLLKKNYNEWAEVSLSTGKMIIEGEKGEGEKYSKYLKWIDGTGKIKHIEDHILGEFGSSIMSKNGRYIAVGLGREIMSPEVDICELYDMDGNRLWKYEIGYPYVGCMNIFNDGSVVIVRALGEDKCEIALMDVKGNKIWKHKIADGTVHEMFSTIEGKILIYISNFIKDPDEFILYGFDKNGRFLWEPKRYVGFDNSFRCLKISEESCLLCGGRVGGYLWVMDINTGKILWEYKLESFNLGDYKTLYQISPDGKYMLLGESILLDPRNAKVLKRIENFFGETHFLSTDQILRKKDNKIEIFNISDILKVRD